MRVVRVTLTCVFSLVSRGMCTASIVNYDNNPLLAEAFRYDLEMNGGNVETADRAKAEEYYLAYVKQLPETNTAQRARVYAQIGALYAVAVNLKRGEQVDREKAKQYFLKVLSLEPDRIGRATIAARAHLAGMAGSRQEKVEAWMDVYGWLHGVDRRQCIARWLPTRPSRDVPDETELRGVINLSRSVSSMAQTNMIMAAASLPDRAFWLGRIIERFPGTEAADLAQKALAKPDPSVQPPVQEPPAASQAAGPSIKRPGVSRLIAEPNDLALPGKPITLSAAPRPPSQEPVPLATARPASGRRFPWWLPALGAAALILAAGAVLLHRGSSPG